jgi:hypothetical protein
LTVFELVVSTGRAHRNDLFQHTEGSQGAQCRAGDGDSRAINPPVGIDLNQVDLQSLLAQLYRTRHTGDTAAHDENSAHVRHLEAPQLKSSRH